MLNRDPHVYKAVVQVANPRTGDSEVIEPTFECHWSPEYEGVLDLVALSATAQVRAKLAEGNTAEPISAMHVGRKAELAVAASEG